MCVGRLGADGYERNLWRSRRWQNQAEMAVQPARAKLAPLTLNVATLPAVYAETLLRFPSRV